MSDGTIFSVSQDVKEEYIAGALVYYGGDLVRSSVASANQRGELPGTPEEIADAHGYVATGRAIQFNDVSGTAAKIAEEKQAADNITQKAAESQTVEEDDNDWRVRLHLAADADYLYKDSEALATGSILAPLAETDGIIFPYTPTIAIQYNADYENYDLVHSNYRGYFYKGSQVQNILIQATFTANDVKEANYMLATMHFLRAATKMFYGQDVKRGMPPPIVFLTGLGEYQFNNHPCAITMMNYNLPNDVDYIPCGKPAKVAPLQKPKEGDSSIGSNRLAGSNLVAGGKAVQTTNPNIQKDTSGPNPAYQKATYVPTKIEFNFTMIPIQTRDQISNEFSLKDYASGKLLKKGFW